MTDPLQDFEPETWLCTVDQVREFRAQLEALAEAGVHERVLRPAACGACALPAPGAGAGGCPGGGVELGRSVRELKGPTRPVNTEEDRAEILMALECVNAVVKFEEPRVTKLIEAIAPHVYAKGGDYTVETLNPEEKAALDQVGAEIKILPLVPGRSTTATLKRVKAGEQGQAQGAQSPAAPAGKRAGGAATQDSGPLRIGILGSGHGSNFEAIHRAVAEGHLEADIRVVISDQADSRILRKAREAGLSTIHVDAGGAGWKLPASAQKEICDHLKRHDVQVVVLAGFMRVLKDPLLSEFADRIVNVHPSLLPKYKGKEAWVQALEEGELETGATVHLVNAEIDGGRILAQGKVPIHIGDTADAVLERIHTVEHEIYPKVLADWRKLGLPTG